MFTYKLSDSAFDSKCSHLNVRCPGCFKQGVQATIECGFTLNGVRDMAKTYSQMHRRGKYWEHSPIICSFWPNGWVFVYELSHYKSESSCSPLNFGFRACFMQRVPWHSDKYRVWIHFERHARHDKDIESNASYKQVLRTQLEDLILLAKWLSVCLQFKLFWVRIHFQSLKLQISGLLRARNSLTFRQLWSLYLLWNAYVIWQEHTVKCTIRKSNQSTAQSFAELGQIVEC